MKQQLPPILLCVGIFIFMCVCILLAGCVTNNNAKEMRLAVPAMFEYRMEYYETGGSETKIGPLVPSQGQKADNSANDELELPKFIQE